MVHSRGQARDKDADPIVSARNLCVHFARARGRGWRAQPPIKAVDGIDLDLYRGGTLGLAGESGCGKSTLARALTGMVAPTAGQLTVAGQDAGAATALDWRRLRRDVQMVFQDPLASLDPRMTAAGIVAEPLRYLRVDLSAAERRRRVLAMLERVGLSPAQGSRYPHEFSGGQCQRIGIARALVVEPRVLICDEAVSALDVSIQARIVDLLLELQAEFGIALLFIAHDLAVVRQISDTITVMYLGRIMEQGAAETLFEQPRHPYTRALLSAVPRPDPVGERQRRRIRLAGDPPSPAAPPSGCVFRTRCAWARADCSERVPALRALGADRRVACHYAEAVAQADAGVA